MRTLYHPLFVTATDRLKAQGRLPPGDVSPFNLKKAIKPKDQKIRKPTGGSAKRSFLTAPGLGETFGATSVRRKTLGVS